MPSITSLAAAAALAKTRGLKRASRASCIKSFHRDISDEKRSRRPGSDPAEACAETTSPHTWSMASSASCATCEGEGGYEGGGEGKGHQGEGEGYQGEGYHGEGKGHQGIKAMATATASRASDATLTSRRCLWRTASISEISWPALSSCRS